MNIIRSSESTSQNKITIKTDEQTDKYIKIKKTNRRWNAEQDRRQCSLNQNR